MCGLCKLFRFSQLDKILALKCNRNNRNTPKSVVLLVGADQLFVLQYAIHFANYFLCNVLTLNATLKV